MIIFETRFREIVDLLPTLSDGSKVRYNWGTIDVLNKYLTVKSSKSKYPLIWLLEDKNEKEGLKQEIKRSAKIVIATKSVNQNEFNDFIFKQDFIQNLNIICDNLITAITKSNIAHIENDRYSYEFKENFSIKDNQKGVLDIWNVIFFEAEIVINNNCINQQIKF